MTVNVYYKYIYIFFSDINAKINDKDETCNRGRNPLQTDVCFVTRERPAFVITKTNQTMGKSLLYKF